MKTYITKYALTEGIFEKEVRQSRDYPTMVSVEGRSLECYHGNDWHLTMEAALERAEEMRIKKIESLKKSLQKMESLKFN